MAEQQDISSAKGTYAGFLKMFKWGAVISAAIAALVVLIIAT
jgi:tetrahydromethanopterin S-methyltransferase subunit B